MNRLVAPKRQGAKAGTPGSKHAGGHRIRVTPVPIPNTEVKPDTADGTAWETVWESRSLPAVNSNKNAQRAETLRWAFLFVLPRTHLRPPRFPMQYHPETKATVWETAWESRSLPA